jgi:hypothetical protein
MPLEIRELQINVTVNQPGSSAPATATPGEKAAGGGDDSKKIINQCIEQVMDIINNKKER